VNTGCSIADEIWAVRLFPDAGSSSPGSIGLAGSLESSISLVNSVTGAGEGAPPSWAASIVRLLCGENCEAELAAGVAELLGKAVNAAASCGCFCGPISASGSTGSAIAGITASVLTQAAGEGSESFDLSSRARPTSVFWPAHGGEAWPARCIRIENRVSGCAEKFGSFGPAKAVEKWLMLATGISLDFVA